MLFVALLFRATESGQFEINICHLILSKQFMHGRGEWLSKNKSE